MTATAAGSIAARPGRGWHGCCESTDFEAESPGHVRFGAERALKTIESQRDKPARAIVDALYQEIAGFTGHRAQRDDITMVVLKVEAND